MCNVSGRPSNMLGTPLLLIISAADSALTFSFAIHFRNLLSHGVMLSLVTFLLETLFDLGVRPQKLRTLD